MNHLGYQQTITILREKKADDETDVSIIVWKVDVVVNTVVSQGPQVGLHPQVK